MIEQKELPIEYFFCLIGSNLEEEVVLEWDQRGYIQM